MTKRNDSLHPRPRQIKGLNDVKHKYSHPRFDCISNENIKAAVELADTYLSDNGIESVKRTRCSLALEEMLLQYQEQDRNRAV